MDPHTATQNVIVATVSGTGLGVSLTTPGDSEGAKDTVELGNGIGHDGGSPF